MDEWMNMTIAFCDGWAGLARLTGKQKNDLLWLNKLRNRTGQNWWREPGQNIMPDSTVSSWSPGVLKPIQLWLQSTRIKFTLGKPKTKMAPAFLLSTFSSVFRMPIWECKGHVKIPEWCISLLCSNRLSFSQSFLEFRKIVMQQKQSMETNNSFTNTSEI